jgi:hypothetical protein
MSEDRALILYTHTARLSPQSGRCRRWFPRLRTAAPYRIRLDRAHTDCCCPTKSVRPARRELPTDALSDSDAQLAGFHLDENVAPPRACPSACRICHCGSDGAVPLLTVRAASGPCPAGRGGNAEPEKGSKNSSVSSFNCAAEPVCARSDRSGCKRSPFRFASASAADANGVT